ncbi:hypothetical protein AAC691_20405 [Nguyenibacter vanlangensis]|uniref:MYXO-CTERM domain-containing protein n=1 Tax=Nguyenibacter vanlangensis TaxID=1216886 RepID=A0ABZ3D532_9PROT
MASRTEFEAALDEDVGRVQDGLDGPLGDPGAPLKGAARTLCACACTAGKETGAAIRDLTVDQPVTALLVAALTGFLAALLWTRR